MVATRLSDGERIWSQDISGLHQPIVSGNTVFLVDAQDRALALDKATGRPRWTVQLPERKQAWAGPLLAGNRLWVASTTATSSPSTRAPARPSRRRPCATRST